MNNFCVQTESLFYCFNKNEHILDNINLQVKEGSIYGFLGPNGAGKTTTLRLLLGLLKNQQGNIRIFNKNMQQHRIEILQKTGSLIESPSLYSHLTAWENLALLCKIYRCSKTEINKVLQMVGLAGTGNKKAGQFSLGMKQRLSIAIAMLNNPRLLILDEPTNGLDPGGIIEMRELLKHINSQYGITIIVSSHLLAEIEKLVTHVGVIHRGNMLFQGTLHELQARQQQSAGICFETSDNISAIRIMNDNKIEATTQNGKIFFSNVPKEIIAAVNTQLVNNKIDVYSIQQQQSDLETIFINLTNN